MWGKDAKVTYDALARTCFGLGVAWIIFACEYGYGGFINTLLTLKAYIPLSKLTFGAYLMHVLMIYTYYYGRYTLFYISTMNVMYVFFGSLFIAYITGILILLLFHYPISVGLERCIRCNCRLRAARAGRYPGDGLARGFTDEDQDDEDQEVVMNKYTMSGHNTEATNLRQRYKPSTY